MCVLRTANATCRLAMRVTRRRSRARGGAVGEPRTDQLATVPLRHLVPGLLRDPLGTVDRVGALAGGRVVRLDLGLFRPFLVTRPEHVQHVLRDNAGNYARDGMM